MSSLPLPPGTFGLPWVGETPSFLFDRQFADKRQARYGSIFKTHILGRPTVVMVGPEANRFLLSSHMDHFSWREGWPPTFRELLGESLFLQEGEQHRRNRKLLMPAFHGKALESYFDTMQQITQRYLTQWAHLGEFAWFDQMKQLTFEIASVLLIGNQPAEQGDRLSRWFSDLTGGLFMLPIRWGWTPYGKALTARDRLLAHIEKVIAERQQNPAQDALSLLLQSRDEAGNALSLEEIKVQALLMLFAGHETTTSMLTSLVMSLAQHQTVYQQAIAEQATLAAQGPLSLAQLRQMPYLDQVLKEVERLYPPVAGGFRGVIKAFEYNGYQVPAGWMALYRIEATHRDRRCYDDPTQFDPDRFSPDRAEHKRFDYSLVGFGGGPRVCIGLAFAQMEMKIVVASLLRHYRWELLPNQNLSMNPIPTLRPQSGLRVRLSPSSNLAPATANS
ncbi:cytochrome P450 [Almyronema epifaneia]|uniref:Cytochrome P450 n=1 Tax=Almyronema epifaneia S1 TaxID=2991925 RepID=A0ABW6IAM9_9CYAN